LKVGVAQIVLYNEIEPNVRKIYSYIESAAKLKLEILCFPECGLTGYVRDFHAVNWDEVIRALDKLQEVAVGQNITIVIGTPYKEAGKVYNAALVMSTNGRQKYFKKNLIDFDKQYFAEGKDMLTFEVKGTRCGILVCRDQNYPPLAWEYARMGTKVIFLLAAHYYPASQTHLKLEKNRALPIARAVENKLFVAKANAVGSQGDYISLGHSMIIDPEGIVVCEANEKQEKLLYHDV
jgi:predicted amidohydrolase